MSGGENRYILIRFSLLFFFLTVQITGCGREETGSPGSWGDDETNTIVRAELNLETASVDICNGADSTARVNFAVEPVNGDLPENKLYLEGYSLEFTALTQGAPAIEDATVSQTAALPANGLEVLFVDAGRKAQFISDVTVGGFAVDFPSYDAEYTFFGKDSFNADFGVVTKATFRIGKYSCDLPLQIQPSSISLSGINGPEEDPSDDITFYISGGVGPYAVYSDNAAVLSVPELAPGAASFTVDPEGAAATVTLTVVDSKGASATALVTVIPYSPP